MLYGLTLASVGQALPSPGSNGSRNADTSLASNMPYVLPNFDPSPTARAAESAKNRAGYLYGPSLIGNSSCIFDRSIGRQTCRMRDRVVVRGRRDGRRRDSGRSSTSAWGFQCCKSLVLGIPNHLQY